MIAPLRTGPIAWSLFPQAFDEPAGLRRDPDNRVVTGTAGADVIKNGCFKSGRSSRLRERVGVRKTQTEQQDAESIGAFDHNIFASPKRPRALADFYRWPARGLSVPRRCLISDTLQLFLKSWHDFAKAWQQVTQTGHAESAKSTSQIAKARTIPTGCAPFQTAYLN
jgi:hypothetical protein